MKKLTIIEIAVIIFVIVTISIYVAPYIIKNKQNMINSQIKANNAIFVSKIIEEFAKNKNAKPSEVSKKVADEINKTEKNPYNKKENLYVFNKDCKACSYIESDDSLKMVILTTFDKDGEIVARTVINPPSFVTYNKNDDN